LYTVNDPPIYYLLQIWLKNVPHTKLVEYKKSQNWVRISGKLLVFPGGGTQFKDGALSYINFIEEVYFSLLLK
jgi:hypothetical protein